MGTAKGQEDDVEGLINEAALLLGISRAPPTSQISVMGNSMGNPTPEEDKLGGKSLDERTKSRIEELESEICELTAALEVIEKDKTNKTDSLYTTINDFCARKKSHSERNDSSSIKTRSQPQRDLWSLTQRDRAYIYETEEDYGLTELKGFQRRYGDSWDNKDLIASTPTMGNVIPLNKKWPEGRKKISIASLGLELSPTFIQKGLSRNVSRKVSLMKDQ